MKVYVANCTKQNIEFAYRVPESTGLRRQLIEMGKQVQLSGDINPKQLESIIRQQTKYGLIDVKEIDRTRDFIGTCYSVDAPIKVDQIRRALVSNDTVLTKRGEQTRMEAAVATSSQIEAANQTPLKSLDVEIIEQPVKGEDQKVNEKITVDHSQPSEPQRSSKPSPKKNSRK